jgi:hypothetical protein
MAMGSVSPELPVSLLYGSDELHSELRARIIKELVQNENKYLSNDCMLQGTNGKCSQDCVKKFAV